MTKLDKCRSCAKPIIWLKTNKGGIMPVNAETVNDGDRIFNEKVHMTHFADCPQSKAWSGHKRDERPPQAL